MASKFTSILILIIETTLSVFPLSCSSGEIESSTIRFNSLANKIESFIDIDIDKTFYNKSIDKDFYGSHFSNFSPIPGEKLVKDLGIGRIRIGGNAHDVYNWENSMTYFPNYGYSKILSFSEAKKLFDKYQTEEIFQVNIMGYMPMVVDGEFRLVLNLDEKHAANMIYHLNKEENLGVKNICLGNEFAQWHETHSYVLNPDVAISADEYIERFIRYAIAIKDAQLDISGNSNDIKIWGPEISASYLDWQTGNMEKDCEWTDVWGQMQCHYGANQEFDHFIPYFLSQIALAENDPIRNPKKHKILDFFTIHYYPNFRTDINDINSIVLDPNGRQPVNEILGTTQLFYKNDYKNGLDISSYRDFKPNILNRMNQWRNENYPDVKFGITEFAVDSDDKTFGYHPMIRPLYMADLIGILATNGVDFFNRFMLNSTSPDLVPWSLIEDEKKTDLYKFYALFANYYKGSLLRVDDNLGDIVNAFAVADEKNLKVNLIIVNKGVEQKNVNIRVKVGASDLRKILTYSIPGWSVSVLKIPNNLGRKNANVKVLEFGARQMSVYLDPYYKK